MAAPAFVQSADATGARATATGATEIESAASRQLWVDLMAASLLVIGWHTAARWPCRLGNTGSVIGQQHFVSEFAILRCFQTLAPFVTRIAPLISQPPSSGRKQLAEMAGALAE
ncbi:hypothetical protein AU189_06890 [Mycolicibacterium acapulense]|uniref:Uncharacterized protein n=1 Tax=Mycobacterium lehmannii TaxID=2048550 RepID=A0A101A3N8_9MYCO|nr:hypothetical protein AU189_06890 [Mycolicibacterium acapulense]KUI12475.1 hypothetical protein AU192_20760 [Mycobacterium lehmannii]